MRKKELIDLITGISLMLIAAIVLLLPSFKVNDLSFILKMTLALLLTTLENSA